jgi:RHS repeat-associated protein
MLLTDTNNGGAAVRWSTGYQPVVCYTAFGDPIYRDPNGVEHVGPLPDDPNAPAEFPRYQYAGGWGYENGCITLQGANATLAPITLQHVGARWYQPGIGRFVQRDPIGIEGGMNVYLYLDGNPLDDTDPDGCGVLDDWEDALVNWLGKHGDAARGLGGGIGNIPVIDYGRAHTAVVVVAEVVSVCAPVGTVGRTITLTPKALALAKKGWAGKYIVRIRGIIRYDRVPHHGQPPGHWNWWGQ